MLLLQGGAIYFISVNLFYILLLFLSWLKIKKYSGVNEDLQHLPPVSFIVPAYNEESLIVETIQTYLSLPQENKEVIVINDGSHDQTMRLLQVMYQLKKTESPEGLLFRSITHPELKVIEAQHLGKAQALNLGVKFARHDIICTMDADTIPTASGVQKCLEAFKKDKTLIAAGGVIQVLSSEELKDNSPLKKRANQRLTSFQRIEYLRTFVCERLGWSFIGSTILISGAFCMLKKEAIFKIGGFSPRSITEDFDLIVRLRKAYKGRAHSFKILPVTTCYTQVPRSIKHLSRQRIRWQMGLIQTLTQNGSLFLHPQHGFLGLIAIPYFWFVEAFSPLISLLAYAVAPLAILNGWISIETILFFAGAGLAFNLMITLIGGKLEKSFGHKHSSPVMRNLWETFLLHFGYKQLTTWWRLLALLKVMTTAPTWGEKPRVELTHLN